MKRASFALRLPFFILALLLALALCMSVSCAPRMQGTPQGVPEPSVDESAGQAPEDQTEVIWKRFAQQVATAEVMSGPFRASGTLRYVAPDEKTNRVSFLLWGNNKSDSPWPLRLDLSAGIGQVVAKVRETSTNFTAYMPDENTAYIHEGGSRTLASFGVPIPLSLSDLALIVTGRGGLLFLPSPVSADAPVPATRTQNGQEATYILEANLLPGELTLSEQGTPLVWKDLTPDGWHIDFESAPERPLFPTKLRIKHGKGWSALITIKDIARVSPPYSAAKLDFALPPNVEKRPLEQ